MAKKAEALMFGHAQETIEFWKRLVREALSLSTPTPFYLCSALPIAEKISELDAALIAAGFQSAIANPKSKIGFRHWLSLKTQPVASLLRGWKEQGRPVEVVSEFELRAALAEGFAPENILVNGPAKHRWLPQFSGAPISESASSENHAHHAGSETGAPLRNLSVNFDSPAELAALLLLAKKFKLALRRPHFDGRRI